MIPDENSNQAMQSLVPTTNGDSSKKKVLKTFQGKQVKVVPSSSQMNFGQRPPEARGKRNKILSTGGDSSN